MLVRTSPKVLPWRHAFWLFLALNVADVTTTIIGILFLHLFEGNPLLVDHAGHFIWWRMVVLKLNVILVYSAFTYFLLYYRRHRALYYIATVLSCVIVSFVVFWNIVLTIFALLHRA